MTMVKEEDPRGLHGVAVAIDHNEFTIVRGIRFGHRKYHVDQLKVSDDLVSRSWWLVCQGFLPIQPMM